MLENSEHPAGASTRPVYNFWFAAFLLYILVTIPEFSILFYGCSPKSKFKRAVKLRLLDLGFFPQYNLSINKNYLAV